MVRSTAVTATVAAAVLAAGGAAEASPVASQPENSPIPATAPESTSSALQALTPSPTALGNPLGDSGLVALAKSAAAQQAAKSKPAASAHPAPQPAPATPPPSLGAAALEVAKTAMGTRYRWGGASPGGFDCSGLVQWSFRKAGAKLPRTSRAQSTVGRPVAKSDLRPGDLVFFYSPVSHVGIYVGNGKVLHAPQAGDVVKISPMNRMPFHSARRV